MNSIKKLVAVIFFALFFICHQLYADQLEANTSGSGVAGAGLEGTVYIQVKITKLRQEPKQWGKSLADLSYADAVSIIEKQSGWLKVRTNTNQEGYIHQSAASGRKILLAATTEAILNTSAEETDVFLAGKGFSAGVLNEYLKKSSNNHTKSLEAMKGREDLDHNTFNDFLSKGKLKDA